MLSRKGWKADHVHVMSLFLVATPPSTEFCKMVFWNHYRKFYHPQINFWCKANRNVLFPAYLRRSPFLHNVGAAWTFVGLLTAVQYTMEWGPFAPHGHHGDEHH